MSLHQIDNVKERKTQTPNLPPFYQGDRASPFLRPQQHANQAPRCGEGAYMEGARTGQRLFAFLLHRHRKRPGIAGFQPPRRFTAAIAWSICDSPESAGASYPIAAAAPSAARVCRDSGQCDDATPPTRFASTRIVGIRASLRTKAGGRARAIRIRSTGSSRTWRAIERPNHMLCADMSDIPMRRGFRHLVAIRDRATRKRPAWRLSNSMDAGFCVATLADALNRFGGSFVQLRSALEMVGIRNSAARRFPRGNGYACLTDVTGRAPGANVKP